jgi:hypothetical protein
MSATIIALAHKVLGRVFGGASWANWRVLLKAAFGYPLTGDELATFCTLTNRTRPPAHQVREAWFIIGRRAGKSMIAALIAIYQTCCRTYRLAPGEVGVCVIICPDRRQSRVVKRYVSGLLHLVEPLLALLDHETADAIHLTNGLVIEIHTASFRSTRGYTICCVIVDELAFLPQDDAADPDTEILAALRPAMATVREAMLIVISSPYARRGELWKAYRTHFGRDEDDVLVAQADTRTMNPTVPEEEIARAYVEDASRAAAEFGGQFRSDVESFVSVEVVDAATTPGRYELPPVAGVCYHGAVDFAGGSGGGDSATAAIAHQDQDQVILDAIREMRPPFFAGARLRGVRRVPQELRRDKRHVGPVGRAIPAGTTAHVWHHGRDGRQAEIGVVRRIVAAVEQRPRAVAGSRAVASATTRARTTHGARREGLDRPSARRARRFDQRRRDRAARSPPGEPAD